jgi:hypothetical protein
MKIRIIFLISLFFYVSNFAFAQEPVIEKPLGTPVPNLNLQNANIQMIADLDQGVLFYQNIEPATDNTGVKQLILYSKDNKEIQTLELSVPDGNNYITSRILEDEVVHFYFLNNVKTRTIQLNTAITGIPESASDSKSLKPKMEFSYNVDPKTTTNAFFSESNDKNYFSICLTTLNELKSINKIYVVVYNKKLEIEWMQEFQPDFKTKQTEISDFKVTNAGKALLLLNTFNSVKKKQTNHELQLVSMFKDNDFTKFTSNCDFGIIQSMKLLVLKNGKYFVAGYYAEKPATNSAGYVTYTFDPRKEKEVLTKYVTKFNDNYKEKEALGYGEPTKINTDYNLKCDYLWELPNDFVVMLGEQFLETKVVDPKKEITTYTYYCKNLFYHQFGLDGINAGYEVYPKPQVGISFSPIQDIHQLGLSYSAFLDGSTVYLLHNDHISRFIDKEDLFNSYDNQTTKEGILVLTRIKKIGYVESKFIMQSTKDMYYQNVWFSDPGKIVFGLVTKKTYNLEQFEIMNEWEWE